MLLQEIAKNKSTLLSIEQTSGKILPLENGNFPLNRNNKTVQARTILVRNRNQSTTRTKMKNKIIGIPLLTTVWAKTYKTLSLVVELLLIKQLKI